LNQHHHAEKNAFRMRQEQEALKVKQADAAIRAVTNTESTVVKRMFEFENQQSILNLEVTNKSQSKKRSNWSLSNLLRWQHFIVCNSETMNKKLNYNFGG